MTDTTLHVVPAEPGWSILHPVKDDDGRVVDFHPDPVVAWAVEIGRQYGDEGWWGHTIPVSADVGLREAAVLRRPDGRIVFVQDRDVEGEGEALAYANEVGWI